MTKCSCPIDPRMSFEDLRIKVLPHMCTRGRGLDRPGYMCPTLDKEFQRARRDDDIKKRQQSARNLRRV